MTTTPQAVSAKLRREGFRPVADYRREGVRVSKGALGRVLVQVQIDTPSAEARMVEAVAGALATWEGYEVEHDADSPFFYVRKL